VTSVTFPIHKTDVLFVGQREIDILPFFFLSGMSIGKTPYALGVFASGFAPAAEASPLFRSQKVGETPLKN
jgi:hypothetical protein